MNNIDSIETSTGLRFEKLARIAMYSLPQKEWTGMKKDILKVKEKLMADPSTIGILYKFLYKDLVVLVKLQEHHFEVVDIMHKQLFNMYQGISTNSPNQ